MNNYTLNRVQTLNCDLDEAWAFFSNPENLNLLTPDDMHFEILSEQPLPTMFENQVIQYRIRPVMNIPMFWETKIIDVKDRSYFTDIQLKGPYKLWRHTHRFEASNGKTIMTDELAYALPMGILGKIAHALFVKNKLAKIFDYRFAKVNELFNQMH